MAEPGTVKQGDRPEDNNQGERTFTQDEVNKMISGRVNEMREQYADYDELKEKANKYKEIEEANKSELQKANEKAAELQSKLNAMEKANEVRNIRTQVSTETGVPVHLLTSDTLEGCQAQAKAILEYAKPAGYPSVKDAGDVPVTPVTKEEILAIENERERLKAIREHIDLF